jgi:hypothetical protein
MKCSYFADAFPRLALGSRAYRLATPTRRRLKNLKSENVVGSVRAIPTAIAAILHDR